MRILVGTTGSALLRGGAILLLVSTLFPGAVLGQTRVTGTVVDAKTGKPLPGANVFVDGKMRGTVADEAGHFALTTLSPGTYSIVGSMVGYEPKQASVTLRPPSEADGPAPRIRFALNPQPIELEGVTVEGSREEWLDRLARFRRAFFGIGVPNAQQCSFANPEVLSFEEDGASLIAHAEKPLRVHNDALGYEITYHLSRYVISRENRTRLGPFEFDTLAAASRAKREEWNQARRRTYRGSFFHFVDALQADAVQAEGFRVRRVTEIGEVSQRQGARFPKTREESLLGAADIFRFADTTGLGVLSVPGEEQEYDYFEVRYVGKKEHPRFAERYRSARSTRPYQRSWIEFVGEKRALIDLRTGDFMIEPGYGRIVQHGHWGWYGTAATALPGEYRPDDIPR
jgi:hypothetical protein